jgi:predicted DNA-binding antitoxin AbrB/MazE fold protein
MPLIVEAVYEGGVLRPVQPLALQEHQRVRITVHPATDADWVAETAGMIRWTGDHETLRHLAEDVELDPQETS